MRPTIDPGATIRAAKRSARIQRLLAVLDQRHPNSHPRTVMALLDHYSDAAWREIELAAHAVAGPETRGMVMQALEDRAHNVRKGLLR